jgi:IMP cyclohydrolase
MTDPTETEAYAQWLATLTPAPDEDPMQAQWDAEAAEDAADEAYHAQFDHACTCGGTR